MKYKSTQHTNSTSAETVKRPFLPPPIFGLAIMFEIGKNSSEVIDAINSAATCYGWVMHYDEPVTIYNTSRASMFITGIITPTANVYTKEAEIKRPNAEMESLDDTNSVCDTPHQVCDILPQSTSQISG